VAQNVARQPAPESPERESTARRAAISTAAAIGVVALALALWKLKLVVALLFSAVTISAAMRPGVDWMAKRRIPRSVGVLVHYAVLLGLVAGFLSFVVPHLVTQVQEAINAANSGNHGGGFKGKLLDELQKRLNNLPSGNKLIHPALSAGETAIKVLVGVLFTFAAAAYWIFERDRTVDFVTGFVKRSKRKKVRDTWELIDLKLGAFVRGQLFLISIVAIMVSTAFWIIGEPYWLLIGISVAILEIVPVVGPLVGLLIAVGAGLTDNWHTAVYAGAALLAIRVAQDYVINPRVLGGVVGISPLIVLVSVSIVGILFGGYYVVLSVPLASLVVTIIDVALRGVEPAEEEIPTVLFSRESE